MPGGPGDYRSGPTAMGGIHDPMGYIMAERLNSAAAGVNIPVPLSMFMPQPPPMPSYYGQPPPSGKID